MPQERAKRPIEPNTKKSSVRNFFEGALNGLNYTSSGQALLNTARRLIPTISLTEKDYFLSDRERQELELISAVDRAMRELDPENKLTLPQWSRNQDDKLSSLSLILMTAEEEKDRALLTDDYLKKEVEKVFSLREKQGKPQKVQGTWVISETEAKSLSLEDQTQSE